MRPPTLRLGLEANELIVDNFAGGGGASLGIEWALGRSPDIAVNHNPKAIAMHSVNHPNTRHLCGDVWDVDPVAVCGGRHVGLAWFSPDCTHFSKSKGAKPLSSKRRALAWVVVRWARTVKPRVIFLENVEEFEDWGPLDADGRPIPAKAGLTFRIWLGKLRAAGYHVEMRQLRACDYGAPTIRKRLFIIARCDGRPIVWPQPTHGPGLPRPHRVAAECIEWSVPMRSIFGRKKPLAENTLRRIARGIQRFVLDSAQPFLIPTTHAGDARVYSLEEPFRTITGAHRGEFAYVAPTLGERKGQAPRSLDLFKPIGTIVAGGQKHALATAFLAKHYGGHEATGSRLQDPISTITARDHHALVTSHMLKLRGSCRDGQRMTAPFPTICAQGTHMGEVRTFLTRYNGTGGPESLQLPLGTITTKPRWNSVHVAGENYEIADIGQRMLTPRELFRGQSFPDSYVIDRGPDGGTFTLETQVALCGNSVSPENARALVSANFADARAEVA